MSTEAPRDPQVGDRVFLQYGPMCGDAIAEVTAKRVTRWGTHWDIVFEDGHTDTIRGYIGLARTSGEHVYADGQIGAYLIPEAA